MAAKISGAKADFCLCAGFYGDRADSRHFGGGSNPRDRQYTAIADAEFLWNGPQLQPQYPLPPLDVGASPVLISRAIVEAQEIPVYLFNAGLPQAPAVPSIDLGGAPARCLSSGNAMDLETTEYLLEQGLRWGEKLASENSNSYVVLGECVVGGTTTALAVLTGLGFAASGKINSSHPICNHEQKWQLVEAGLRKAGLGQGSGSRGRRQEAGGRRQGEGREEREEAERRRGDTG